MRRRTLGLALALSVTFTFAAQAGPARGPSDENPAAPLPAAAGLVPKWRRFDSASSEKPAPRMGSYAVVDPDHDRMAVFGGWGFGYFSDTWTLDLATATWTKGTGDTTHPGPRMEYASIHDPVRNRMIVFGGKDPYTNEVWTLDLSGTPTWTRLTTAGFPPSPREARAIYDPIRDRMLVFGGYNPAGHLNELWALTLSGTPTWSHLGTVGSPPPARRGQTLVYDPGGDRMLVFGGYNDVIFMNDLWALDLGTLEWHTIVVGGAPSARYGHSATFDPDRNEMVVFGGYDGAFLNDLYVLSLTGAPAWTHVTGTPVPSVRDFHSAVYDHVRRRIVLFGGNDGNVDNDLWALDTATRTWSRLGQDTPAPRLGTYAVVDANSQRMVMFGGWGNEYFDDTWTLALDQPTPQWTLNRLATHPSARLEHATAYDGTRDRMLLFGGKDATRFYNDVWQLDLTGEPAWSRVTTAGVPPGPRETRAVYDPVRDRLLFFGGFSPGAVPQHLNETWELTLSGTPTWRQLTPTGLRPPARRGQDMIYDPDDDRVLVFGGYDNVSFFDDAWALTLARGHEQWIPVATAGTRPTARYGASATLDPVRRVMLVFGGYNGLYLDDGAALPLDRGPRWTPLAAQFHPGPTDFHTMVYDADRDRFLLFGGNNGQPLGDLWELSFGSGIQQPQSLPGDGQATALSGIRLGIEAGTATLHLTLPGVSPARLELFDIAGRRLATRSFKPAAGMNVIPLAEVDRLPAGIYLVRVAQDGKSVVGRALVTR